MELIIAIVLFVAIVASWLVLPSMPPAEKPAAHGAPASTTKANRPA